MSNNKKIVIAGAGMTGLMCALKLTKKIPGDRIVVFDKAPVAGGMYNSVIYDDGRIFDHGMHVIYESCNPEVDDLYLDVMPPSEWNIHEKNRKDIAGVFFAGTLQKYSHYVDLRSSPAVDRKEFLGELLLRLSEPTTEVASTALQFLRNHFGNAIVDKVHKPLLKSLYSIEPDRLDTFAIKATALERVVLFDSATMRDLMKADAIRARIAFPDQLNLPAYRLNSQRALYPKKFGMGYFVERLQQKLASLGVRVMTGTSLAKLVAQGNQVEEAWLSGPGETPEKIRVEKMIWTGGWPALAMTLGTGISDISFQRGVKIVFVNITLDRPPLMDELYYFYCYDSGFASFRVTNYSSYCPDAARYGEYPVCVELWPSRIGLAAETLSDEECGELAISEMKKMGVLDAGHKIVDLKVGSRVGEFPLPTVENRIGLNEIKARVGRANLSNMIVAGVMAEDGLFFIPDILNDAVKKLDECNFDGADNE